MLQNLEASRVIEAEELVSGAELGGLIAAVPIASAGSFKRRPPVFVNSRGVPAELRDRVNVAFAQEHSVQRPLHLLSLADAVVVGQGSVLVQHHGEYSLLRDSAREFLAHNLVPDGMERSASERFVVRQSIRRRIEQNCLLLQRPWSNNFGHWLVDQAMALSYLVHRGLMPTREIVVCQVKSVKLRDVMLQTIAAILPDAVVHEHPDTEVWKFSQLNYIMPLHVPPMTKLPAALDCLRDDLLAVPVPEVKRPRRFHVVRQGEFRKLVNEPEIMSLSAAYGFEPISPECLSMVEQAALFNQAEAVIGVKGAAMTNIIFAKADCKVMILSPGSFIDPFFWDIASVRGIAYGELFGSAKTERASLGHNDFHVRVADVEAMIRMTLSAGSWSV